MLVDKQSELMSGLLFTVDQHGGDDVTWKPPIEDLYGKHSQTHVQVYNAIKEKLFIKIQV